MNPRGSKCFFRVDDGLLDFLTAPCQSSLGYNMSRLLALAEDRAFRLLGQLLTCNAYISLAALPARTQPAIMVIFENMFGSDLREIL